LKHGTRTLAAISLFARRVVSAVQLPALKILPSMYELNVFSRWLPRAVQVASYRGRIPCRWGSRRGIRTYCLLQTAGRKEPIKGKRTIRPRRSEDQDRKTQRYAIFLDTEINI